LEFDHLDGSNKSWNISDLLGRASSLDRVQREIDKCEVVCANCHRIRTVRRDNHWRNAVVQDSTPVS
jgi:hypothetical protein